MMKVGLGQQDLKLGRAKALLFFEAYYLILKLCSYNLQKKNLLKGERGIMDAELQIREQRFSC